MVRRRSLLTSPTISIKPQSRPLRADANAEMPRQIAEAAIHDHTKQNHLFPIIDEESAGSVSQYPNVGTVAVWQRPGHPIPQRECVRGHHGEPVSQQRDCPADVPGRHRSCEDPCEQRPCAAAAGLREAGEKGGALLLPARIELDERRRRGAADHPDRDALGRAGGEQPGGVACRREEDQADRGRCQAAEDHRPAAEAVGESAEQQQRWDQAERVDGEDRREHEAREPEMLGVDGVERRRQVDAGHEHEPADPDGEQRSDTRLATRRPAGRTARRDGPGPGAETGASGHLVPPSLQVILGAGRPPATPSLTLKLRAKIAGSVRIYKSICEIPAR